MYTYTGVQVDIDEGAPTTRDVAVTMGRLPRLCGASDSWWTYLHYSFSLVEIALMENVEYDFEPDEVAAQALIKEAHSVSTLLWKPGRDLKDVVQQRIHEEWDVSYPQVDSQMRELIDRAATRAFLAEVETFAPASMKALPIFGDASPDDCKIVRGIWDIHCDPESTAGNNPEPVQAYELFFKERDISRLRHRVGYDKKRWFSTICLGNRPHSNLYI